MSATDEMTDYEKLVEKVARALAVAFNDIGDGGYVYWQPYKDEARAVISAIYEALKEPTPEMLLAAYYRLENGEDLEDRYAAMLAASPLNGGRDDQ